MIWSDIPPEDGKSHAPKKLGRQRSEEIEVKYRLRKNVKRLNNALTLRQGDIEKIVLEEKVGEGSAVKMKRGGDEQN